MKVSVFSAHIPFVSFVFKNKTYPKNIRVIRVIRVHEKNTSKRHQCHSCSKKTPKPKNPPIPGSYYICKVFLKRSKVIAFTS